MNIVFFFIEFELSSPSAIKHLIFFLSLSDLFYDGSNRSVRPSGLICETVSAGRWFFFAVFTTSTVLRYAAGGFFLFRTRPKKESRDDFFPEKNALNTTGLTALIQWQSRRVICVPNRRVRLGSLAGLDPRGPDAHDTLFPCNGHGFTRPNWLAQI